LVLVTHNLKDDRINPRLFPQQESVAWIERPCRDTGIETRLLKCQTSNLAGKPVSTPLTNPIGCNVKWEGKDAHWMPAEACDLA